jgi:AraC-like DNA-binding protein
MNPRIGPLSAPVGSCKRGCNAAQRLVAALIQPGVDVASVVAGAHALRLALAPRGGYARDRYAERASQRLPVMCLEPHTGALRDAVTKLEALNSVATREEEISDQVGLSAAHLGRMLRRETGMSFRDWRLALVMRDAAKLILADGDRVAQVAYTLGYEPSNVSQFTRDFHRFFGLCPSAFRQAASLRVGSERQPEPAVSVGLAPAETDQIVVTASDHRTSNRTSLVTTRVPSVASNVSRCGPA